MSRSSQSKRITGADRRRQILSVARDVFVGSGYAGARIQEIASTAGVTEALVYKHFSSKENLFTEAIIEPLDTVIDEQLEKLTALPIDSSGAPHRQAMYEFVRALLEVFVETIEPLCVVLFGEREAGRKFYIERLRLVIDAMANVAQLNLSRYRHREFDTGIAAEALFGSVLGIAVDHSFTDRVVDVDRYAQELTDLIFFGAAARDA